MMTEVAQWNRRYGNFTIPSSVAGGSPTTYLMFAIC